MPHGGRALMRDPSTADVVATANTLNYALGNLGGKRKSWMSTAQATSPEHNLIPPTIRRKPGRPPKPRPAELPQTGAPSQTHGERQHPASNSTSPQLANVVSHQASRVPLPSPTAVLPSPSPSEEAVIEPAATPSNRIASPNTSTDHTRGNTAQNASAMPGSTLPDTSFVQDLQAASTLKRPGELGAMEVDKRRRMGSAYQRELTYPTSSRTEVPLPLQHQPVDMRRAYPGQEQSASQLTCPVQMSSPSLALQTQQPQSPYLHNPAPQGVRHFPLGQSRAETTAPQMSTPYGLPRSSSRGTTQQTSGVSVLRNDVPSWTPLGPAALAGAEWYTQQQCMEVIRSFLASYGNPAPGMRDASRLKLLKDAVEQSDWPYLSMHQYYCLLTADSAALPASIKKHPHLPSAMRFLDHVLDPNEYLAPAVLRFFADFPCSLADLEIMCPKRSEIEASLFLDVVLRSPNFDPLKTACERRSCPPLMRELVYDLGIRSVVFQRVVFTATMRHLWYCWGVRNQTMQAQFEAQALSLLEANQVDFYQRLHRQPSIQPRSQEHEHRERGVEMHHWGDQLRQLCAYFQQILRPHVVQSAFLLGQQAQSNAQHQTSVQSHHRPQSYTFQTSVQPMSPPPAQAVVQRGRGRGRPRLHSQQSRPPPPSSTHKTTRPSVPAPLLPTPGLHQPQQRQSNPARFALHQSHLRSPLLRARSGGHLVMHQYVKGFVKPPVRLTDAGHKVERWTFTLTPEELKAIPKDDAGIAGAPCNRNVDEESRVLRVRCTKWTSPVLPDEHSWATADTSWIPYSYFKFNGEHLHQRKKLHHGKDLPIDISALAREGDNTLEIAVMRQPSDESYREYLVAIENLGFKSHSNVLGDCQTTKFVSASTMKASIKRKLSGGSDDDDEITIVESNLSINLFDPFSASKICDIPARSSACPHHDCFDLETFLKTRKKQGNITVANMWKCPICNGDARPQHLIVDGFLVEVRQALERQGLQRTRAIVVDRSGSWKPKAEVLDPNGVHDRRTPDDEPLPSRRQSSAQTEVVDLSD